MQIRVLNQEHEQIFHTIRRQAIAEIPEAFAESVSGAGGKSLENFANHLDPHGRGDFILGAFADPEELAGMIGFYRGDRIKLRHQGILWGMYVRPPYRRDGVAAALMSAAIERIRNLSGLRQIHLSVSDDNEAAKALYEGFGFHTYGVEIGALKVAGGYLDEQLMLLQLS